MKFLSPPKQDKCMARTRAYNEKARASKRIDKKKKGTQTREEITSCKFSNLKSNLMHQRKLKPKKVLPVETKST